MPLSDKIQNGKIICIGGCGCNIAGFMTDRKIAGITTVAAHSEKEILAAARADIYLQIADDGQACGPRPNIGRMRAKTSLEFFNDVLQDTDIFVIVAGLGSGTGTGTAPVIADIGKKRSIPCVAVVTTPFSHEGRRQHRIAKLGVERISQMVDVLFVFQNSRLEKLGKERPFIECLEAATQAISGAAVSSMTIIQEGNAATSILGDRYEILAGGMAGALSSDRVRVAVENAFGTFLFKHIDVAAIERVLVGIDLPEDFTDAEFNLVLNEVRKRAPETALVRMGIRRAQNSKGVFSMATVAVRRLVDFVAMENQPICLL